MLVKSISALLMAGTFFLPFGGVSLACERCQSGGDPNTCDDQMNPGLHRGQHQEQLGNHQGEPQYFHSENSDVHGHPLDSQSPDYQRQVPNGMAHHQQVESGHLNNEGDEAQAKGRLFDFTPVHEQRPPADPQYQQQGITPVSAQDSNQGHYQNY